MILLKSKILSKQCNKYMNIKSKFGVVIKLCYFARVIPHTCYLYTPSLNLPTSLLRVKYVN